MSKNIHQIFVANPATSMQSTDLMYLGRSPYGATDDFAITYANFSAAFSPSVLTTKGDLYTFSTVNARLAVGSTNGQMLQVASAAATGLAWSTATYPATTTINQILYSSAANTVTGLATTNNSSLSTNATGVPTWLALTDGQIVVGSSAGAPLAATITPGAGISVSNGNNTITISTTGANPWVDETGSSVTMAVNTGYTSDDGASLVTFTLPATAAIGDWIEINGKGAGGWTLIEGTGQTIHFGNQTTTITTGSLASTNQYDCVRLRCITANTTFTVVSSVGNLTVV